MPKRSLSSIPIIIGLILIILISATSLEIKMHFYNYFPIQLTNNDIFLLLKNSLLIFLLGILIEWDRIIHLQYNKIKLNKLFIVAFVLTVYSFIPIFYWVEWLGSIFSSIGMWGIKFFANYISFFLSSSQVQTIITLLAGILFIRSLENK